MMARLAAVIVLMLGLGTAAGAESGRLFFTPAQRASLDKLRDLGAHSTVARGTDDNEPAQQQHVRVDGVLRRSDGKSTVWLNNRAVSSGQTSGIDIAVGKNDNRVKLTIPESSRSIELKVGQTVEIVSGAIDEGYARRALPKPVAKVTPEGDNRASSAAKVTSSPASRPVESKATTNDGTRAGDGNAQQGLRPDSGPAPKK